MPRAGFEPAIPASERPQTHVFDRAATHIPWTSQVLGGKPAPVVTCAQQIAHGLADWPGMTVLSFVWRDTLVRICDNSSETAKVCQQNTRRERYRCTDLLGSSNIITTVQVGCIPSLII
jgi:hypothetical protein